MIANEQKAEKWLHKVSYYRMSGYWYPLLAERLGNFRNSTYLCSKKNINRIMEVKKVTYEEALARFKRSLEIKRNAEKRMAEEWKAMGLTGTIVSL